MSFRQTTAYIGLGSVIAFIFLLVVIPQVPYFHLVPWVESEVDFEVATPQSRPRLLLLYTLLFFLPLNGIILFWGNIHRWLYHNQLSTLGNLSAFFLQTGFVATSLLTFLALYGEFYGTAENFPFIFSILSLSFVLWAVNLDVAAALLILGLGMAAEIPPWLFRLGLFLVGLQLLSDVAILAPDLPRWVYGASTLPLPSFMVILSAYWLSYAKPSL